MWSSRTRDGHSDGQSPGRLEDSLSVDGRAVSERSPIDGIAHGMCFNGEIRGDADLTVAGQIAGSVFLPGRRVFVTDTGEVNADITCRVLEIEGMVRGNLRATDRVTIRKTSHVKGDIVSPQIELEEGCQFKGSVRMHKPDVDHVPPAKPKMVSGPGAVRVKADNEVAAEVPKLQTVLDL